ncbi:MAG: hypothetical protein AB8B55_00195 [Mariniblastus sp.]
MKLEHNLATRRLRRKGPLGKVSALLTASVVALIGLTAGLEPHIILWRACVSAVLMGSLVSFGLGVIYLANHTRE